MNTLKTIQEFLAQLALAWLVLGTWQLPAAWAGDGSCTSMLSRVCVEGPATRTISGRPVTRDCWKWESKYECVASTYTDECTPLVEKGCAQIGSKCVTPLDSDPFKCSLYEQTYQCKVASGASKTVTDCGGRSFCMDGACFDAGYTPDGDFGIAMTGMEAARQAGNYLDPSSLTLFNGKSGQCSIKLGGLGNCCKKDTKATTSNNSSLMSGMGVEVAKRVGTEAINYLGSTQVYDALFQSDAPSFLVSGLSALVGSGSSYTAGSALTTASFSYFGVTVGYGSVAAGATLSSTIGTTTVLSSSAPLAAGAATGPGFYLAFNPAMFAVAIVIYIIIELLACTQDEQVLAMRNGQNLCAHVGSYCNSKVGGSCVQKKQSYCCYNSRLARIIAVEGRKQLGMGFGTPEKPNCTGFTGAQIKLIDFSLIDFSEVVADMVASVKAPDHAIGRATTKIESYYTIP